MNSPAALASTHACAECLKLSLRQQVRRASSNAAAGTSSEARNRGKTVVPGDFARYPGGGQTARGSHPRHRDAASSGRTSLQQNYGRTGGGAPPASASQQYGRQQQRPGAAAQAFNSRREPAAIDKAPKQVNFAQGSALSAFLAKAASAKKAPATAAASSPPVPRAPSQGLRTPKMVPTANRNRLRAGNRASSRPRKKVEIAAATSVATMARLLGLKVRRLQLLMEKMGMSDTRPDRLLTPEDASLVALELGFEAVVEETDAFDIHSAPPPSDPSRLPLRPPIVTIMGHVDHGKTSLLDALRSTRVAAGEAGGITQHIGAFSVPLSSLLSNFDASSSTTSTGSITFLDTPGHAAFTAMRSRGASVTDVVVLVVAADDGVKPQTEEVIKLIRNEDVGIVVALTKCDKPGIDISRVHNQLLEQGLEVEAIGGDIPCVEVSAHTGDGLPDLVETINVIAEVRDLRAERSGVPAEARVIESRVEKGRGNVATIIVIRGALRTGSNIIAGTVFGKVRQLTTSDGKVVEEASPGMPVEVTGWKDLPEAGDEVIEAMSEEDAKEAIETRKRKIERRKEMGDVDIINEKRRIESEAATLLKKLQEEAKAAGEDPDSVRAAPSEAQGSGIKELRLIVKADFSGTVEAVSNSLAEIGNHEAKVKLVSSGVGDVTDGDLTMAKAVDGVVVCFNVKAPRSIVATAASLNVPILVNNVIYRLIDEVKERVIELLPKQYDTRVLGEGTIQQVFCYNMKGVGLRKVAGCRITNGSLFKNQKVRVLRDKEVVFSGDVASLKHHKADIEEARKGTECGLNFEGFEDFQEGDTFQSYEETLRVRTL